MAHEHYFYFFPVLKQACVIKVNETSTRTCNVCEFQSVKVGYKRGWPGLKLFAMHINMVDKFKSHNFSKGTAYTAHSIIVLRKQGGFRYTSMV